MPYRTAWHSVTSSAHPDAPSAALDEVVTRLQLETQMRRPQRSDDQTTINFCIMAVGAPFQGALESLSKAAYDRLGEPATFLAVVGAGVIGGGVESEFSPSIALLAGALPPGSLSTPFIFGRRRDLVSIYSEDAWRQTERLFRALQDEPHRPSFLVFGDPFAPVSDATKFIDECEPGAVVVGGVTSPTTSGVSSIAINGEKPLPAGSVAGVALRGPRLRIHTVTAQGAVGVGPVFNVTSGRLNLVATLDERPALQQLQRVALDAVKRQPRLAKLIKANAGLLVGLSTPVPAATRFSAQEITTRRRDGDDDPEDDDTEEEYGGFVIRTVVGATADGAIAVGDNAVLPGRTKLRVHVRDGMAAKAHLDACIERYSLERSFAGMTDATPQAIFVVSCSGRGAKMYGMRNYEVDYLSHLIDAPAGEQRPRIPVGGLFANGELGPIGARLPRVVAKRPRLDGEGERDVLDTAGPTHLHGLTSVVAFLYDLGPEAAPAQSSNGEKKRRKRSP